MIASLLSVSSMGVSADNTFKETKKLNTRKASQVNNFPANILKQSADIFTANMCNFFNFCVNESKFPSLFKKANVIPAFKKGYRGSKENYHTVNVLLVIAKIFGRLLSKQGAIFMDQVLSK